MGKSQPPPILWMDEILHHLRNPGMIRFPCKYQANGMVPRLKVVGEADFATIHSISRFKGAPREKPTFLGSPRKIQLSHHPYFGWTNSYTTLKPWKTYVCWYLQGNHHFRGSWVVRSGLRVHPIFHPALLLTTSSEHTPSAPTPAFGRYAQSAPVHSSHARAESVELRRPKVTRGTQERFWVCQKKPGDP